jgi:hypothetical protein
MFECSLVCCGPCMPWGNTHNMVYVMSDISHVSCTVWALSTLPVGGMIDLGLFYRQMAWDCWRSFIPWPCGISIKRQKNQCNLIFMDIAMLVSIPHTWHDPLRVGLLPHPSLWCTTVPYSNPPLIELIDLSGGHIGSFYTRPWWQHINPAHA